MSGLEVVQLCQRIQALHAAGNPGAGQDDELQQALVDLGDRAGEIVKTYASHGLLLFACSIEPEGDHVDEYGKLRGILEPGAQ